MRWGIFLTILWFGQASWAYQCKQLFVLEQRSEFTNLVASGVQNQVIQAKDLSVLIESEKPQNPILTHKSNSRRQYYQQAFEEILNDISQLKWEKVKVELKILFKQHSHQEKKQEISKQKTREFFYPQLTKVGEFPNFGNKPILKIIERDNGDKYIFINTGKVNSEIAVVSLNQLMKTQSIKQSLVGHYSLKTVEDEGEKSIINIGEKVYYVFRTRSFIYTTDLSSSLQNPDPKNQKLVPGGQVEAKSGYRYSLIKNSDEQMLLVIFGGIKNSQDFKTEIQIYDLIKLSNTQDHKPWLVNGGEKEFHKAEKFKTADGTAYLMLTSWSSIYGPREGEARFVKMDDIGRSKKEISAFVTEGFGHGTTFKVERLMVRGELKTFLIYTSEVRAEKYKTLIGFIDLDISLANHWKSVERFETVVNVELSNIQVRNGLGYVRYNTSVSEQGYFNLNHFIESGMGDFEPLNIGDYKLKGHIKHKNESYAILIDDRNKSSDTYQYKLIHLRKAFSQDKNSAFSQPFLFENLPGESFSFKLKNGLEVFTTAHEKQHNEIRFYNFQKLFAIEADLDQSYLGSLKMRIHNTKFYPINNSNIILTLNQTTGEIGIVNLYAGSNGNLTQE